MTDVLAQDQIRITDADRGLGEAWLRQAHADGALDLAEFDQRTARLWQEARTRGDLDALTADLPNPASEVQPAPPPALSDEARALRVLTKIWLSVSAVNFVVWLVVTFSVAGLDPQWLTSVHPWWVWVLAGPGSVLGLLWAKGLGRRRR
jgi:hypothetical protein